MGSHRDMTLTMLRIKKKKLVEHDQLGQKKKKFTTGMWVMYFTSSSRKYLQKDYYN